jgi:UDP-N-acetylglucosamine 2-epimerase
MRKALFIYGTRPEAIKMAPVILECRKQQSLQPILCVTGQHRELLEELHGVFDLKPDYDLGLMRPNQTLPDLTAAAITAVTSVLAAVKPDVSLVQGDTTSAFAGALASFYQRVPVAHVEAGLRTGDLTAPYPEELNRQLIGRIARWHFAPTEQARENLIRENTPAENIEITGNTSIDALHLIVMRADDPAAAARAADPAASRGGRTTSDLFAALGLAPLATDQRLVLVTAHRRESFGRPFADLCQALRAIADTWPHLRVVYPVHPNPNVRGPAAALLGDHPRIHLIDPVGYQSFVLLMRSAWLVLTDSGGIQEEAPGLGKPVLVLRETTERPEAIAAGTARLVGTSPERIQAAVAALISDPALYANMATARNPFGDGHAAARIVARLVADLAS